MFSQSSQKKKQDESDPNSITTKPNIEWRKKWEKEKVKILNFKDESGM